jgi:hypothetical protein
MLLSPFATFSVLGLCVGYGFDEDLCPSCTTQRNAPHGEASDEARLGATRHDYSYVKNARFSLFCGPGARRYLLYIHHALGQAVRKTVWNGLASVSPEAISTLEWWASDEPWKRNGHQMILERRHLQVSVRN